MELPPEHNLCTGCAACAESCPKNAIQMIPGEYGFLYPQIDQSICIECKRCLNVCPIGTHMPPQERLKVFAARISDENILKTSSSGGIFPLLAQYVLSRGGVVCGAAFNEHWEVEHIIIEHENELEKLQGSKYVQSSIGHSFREIKKLLEQGKYVLFSGTPCQTLGLKRMLGKDYSNLLSVDLVCHGVPSPMIWQKYLKEKSTGKIEKLSFRNKNPNGWRLSSFFIKYISGEIYQEACCQNLFVSGFMDHLYLRKSCENCIAKKGSSQSDITIGDFWNIADVVPEWAEDNQGASVVLINTAKGEKLFEGLSCEKMISDFRTAIKGNPNLLQSSLPSVNKEKFFREIQKNEDVVPLISQMLKITFWGHIRLSLRYRTYNFKEKIKKLLNLHNIVDQTTRNKRETIK